MMKHKTVLAMASAMLGLMLVVNVASVSAQDKGPEPVKKAKEAPKPSSVKLSGQVMGADGKPLSGATVSPVWTSTEKGMTSGSRGMFKATTDANGMYTMEMRPSIMKRQAIPMVCYSDDGKQVAVAIAKKSADPKDVSNLDMTLADGVEISAKIKEGKKTSKSSMAIIKLELDGESHQIIAFRSTSGSISGFVPTGKISVTFHGSSRDVKPQERTFEAKAGDEAKDFGTLSLEVTQTVFNSGVGKPAPEISVTHFRNTKHKSLAAFKGKWVLLDFWGVW